MKLTDFNNGQVWSILPDVLEGMIQRYRSASDIDTLSVDVKALLGKSEVQEGKPYDVTDRGVAIIPVVGPIMRDESIWSLIFSEASIEALTRTLTIAGEDPDVKAVVLMIDSPGGTVSGIDTASDMVSAFAKPIVAFGGGMITSAAYWIGSAARSVIVEKTSQVGGIGVLMVHEDWSERDRMEGLKRTFLSAGKYKTVGNDAEPLSSDARAIFEGRLGYYYTLFVDAVARNRKEDPETVIEKMAEGRVFIGSQAVEAGLADATGTLQTAIDAALSLTGETRRAYKAVSQPRGEAPGKELVMSDKQEQVTSITTVEQLAAAYPALADALRKEGAKTIDQEQIKAEASTSERERILGLVAIQFGEEAGKKLRTVADQGITPDAFKAVMEAMGTPMQPSGEIKGKAEILAALKGSGAENPGAGNPPVTESGKDFMALVDEYAQARNVSKTVAMQAVMKARPEAHREYIKKFNA